MAKSKSRLQPQHGQWFEDLPKAGGPEDEPFIEGGLNWVTDRVLEVSRAASRQRGALLVISAFGIGVTMFAIAFIFPLWIEGFVFSEDALVLALVVPLVSALCAVNIWGVRMELTAPRDEPIRLNRHTGKVYVNHFEPPRAFGRSSATIREFNWADVHCELIRYVQFNSRFFVMRYGLDLAICKPGTLEVVERIWLERNSPFHDPLRRKWQYIVAYMEGTPLVDLPPTAPRSQAVSWRNSFDMWMPWVLDPKTYFGKHPLLFLLTMIFVLLAPIMLLAVIGHYVAMRFSPQAKWPKEVDAACGLAEGEVPPMPVLPIAPPAAGAPKPVQADLDERGERAAQTRKSIMFVVVFCAAIGLIVFARSMWTAPY